MDKKLFNHKIEKAMRRVDEMAERNAEERAEDEYQAELAERSDRDELQRAQRI